jgi:hypothetical protein
LTFRHVTSSVMTGNILPAARCTSLLIRPDGPGQTTAQGSLRSVSERGHPQGDEVLRLLLRHGEEDACIAAKPGRLVLFLRFGNEAGEYQPKTGHIDMVAGG